MFRSLALNPVFEQGFDVYSVFKKKHYQAKDFVNQTTQKQAVWKFPFNNYKFMGKPTPRD